MFATQSVTPTSGKMDARKELRLHRADEERILGPVRGHAFRRIRAMRARVRPPRARARSSRAPPRRRAHAIALGDALCGAARASVG